LGLLAVVICVIGVVYIAIGSLRRYRERKLATSIVLEMLNRRMPFDQIRAVILALDMDDDLDRACTLRRPTEGASTAPDPANGEAAYCVGIRMSSPLPSRLSGRNAMWWPQRAAI
jgi:hypothetical protein